jgi:hypothetical protein
MQSNLPLRASVRLLIGLSAVLVAFGGGPTTASAGSPAQSMPAAKQALLDQASSSRAAALRSVPAAPKVGAAGAVQAASLAPLCPASGCSTGPSPVDYSRYVQPTPTSVSNDKFDLYTMGCDQGKSSDSLGQPTQIVLLNYGDPGIVNGHYGAWDSALGGFVPIGSVGQRDSIAWAASRYMQGFWSCTAAGSHSFMTVAPGTNNHGGGPVNYAHGQAWANMVSGLNSWITSSGYTAQLWAYGADDIETTWSTPAAARDWINGFASVGGLYFDDGDAAGCPASGSGACHPKPCWGPDYGWTTADEYFAMWGATPALPVPEIYGVDPSVNSSCNPTAPGLPLQATEWEQIALYGASHGGAPTVSAALSQYQACNDKGWSCTGDHNTPDQSYQQMQNALNSSSSTARAIPYRTEMSYQNP